MHSNIQCKIKELCKISFFFHKICNFLSMSKTATYVAENIWLMFAFSSVTGHNFNIENNMWKSDEIFLIVVTWLRERYDLCLSGSFLKDVQNCSLQMIIESKYATKCVAYSCKTSTIFGIRSPKLVIKQVFTFQSANMVGYYFWSINVQ